MKRRFGQNLNWIKGEQHLKEKERNLYENTRCFKQLHENKYCLWSAKMIEALINDKYPELLSIYNEYPYDIMKIHLAKYVILCEYGGFFVDIDCVPKRNLYDLIMHQGEDNNYHKVLLCADIDHYKTVKSTNNNKFFSNHFMFSPCSKHPLLQLILVEATKTAKKKPLEPHLTHFLRAIGPYFLGKCVKKYKKMINKRLKQYEKEHKLEGKEQSKSLSSLSSMSWSNLSTISLKEKIFKHGNTLKVHTSDVVDIIGADILDFYFIHDHLNESKLEREWINELKFHNKLVLSSGQVALTAVCVGALMLVLA